MSTGETKKECKEDKKEEKKDSPLQLVECFKTKTTTTSSFFLPKFNSKDTCEVKLPSNFTDLDQLLKKILFNLEETENQFLNQAKSVMDRDLCIINWRFKLDALYTNLIEKKRDFERIDQTVQCIQKLTSHTDDILNKLEKELPGSLVIENALKYSPIRVNMHDAIMKINISQRDLLQQLTSVINSMNEIISCNPSDPVEQFTRVLSLHAEVLRKIETQMSLLEEELESNKNLMKHSMNTKNCYRWFVGSSVRL